MTWTEFLIVTASYVLVLAWCADDVRADVRWPRRKSRADEEE